MGKAYDPNQPRIPAGQTGGGEWTDGSGGAGAPPPSRDRIRIADSGQVATDVPQSSPNRALAFLDGSDVIDPNTGKPYPVPPGMDIAANVARGRSIASLAGPFTIDGVPADARAIYMASWLAAGQPMDYQRPNGIFGPRAMQYRNVTNYNFGAVAAAAGYTLEQALTAAGSYNRTLGNPQPTDTNYGIPRDAVANITQGWNDSRGGKWSEAK